MLKRFTQLTINTQLCFDCITQSYNIRVLPSRRCSHRQRGCGRSRGHGIHEVWQDGRNCRRHDNRNRYGSRGCHPLYGGVAWDRGHCDGLISLSPSSTGREASKCSIQGTLIRTPTDTLQAHRWCRRGTYCALRPYSLPGPWCLH